jgi:hypothetical protein
MEGDYTQNPSMSETAIYRRLTLRNVTNHNTFIDLLRSQS